MVDGLDDLFLPKKYNQILIIIILILTGRVKLYLRCKATSSMTDFSSYTLKEQLISTSLWLSEFFLNLSEDKKKINNLVYFIHLRIN